MHYITGWAFCDERKKQAELFMWDEFLTVCQPSCCTTRTHPAELFTQAQALQCTSESACTKEQSAELFSLNNDSKKSCYCWDGCSTEPQPNCLQLKQILLRWVHYSETAERKHSRPRCSCWAYCSVTADNFFHERKQLEKLGFFLRWVYLRALKGSSQISWKAQRWVHYSVPAKLFARREKACSCVCDELKFS